MDNEILAVQSSPCRPPSSGCYDVSKPQLNDGGDFITAAIRQFEQIRQAAQQETTSNPSSSSAQHLRTIQGTLYFLRNRPSELLQSYHESCVFGSEAESESEPLSCCLESHVRDLTTTPLQLPRYDHGTVAVSQLSLPSLSEQRTRLNDTTTAASSIATTAASSDHYASSSQEDFSAPSTSDSSSNTGGSNGVPLAPNRACARFNCETNVARLTAKIDRAAQQAALRIQRLERRASGGVETFIATSERRVNNVRRKLRRRRSLTEKTLEQLETHREHLHFFRELASQPKHWALLRRCRSAVSLADLPMGSLGQLQNSSSSSNSTATMGFQASSRDFGCDGFSPASAGGYYVSPRIRRKRSLTSLGTAGSGELWPESITSLLTSGQLLLDRVKILSQLQALSPQPQSSTGGGLEAPEGILSSQQERYEQLAPLDEPELWLISGGISIPRPDKHWGGEDAFFTCESAVGFLGVADGVGEWGELGCNPRQFANEVMIGSKREAERIFHEEGCSNSDNAGGSTSVESNGDYVTQQHPNNHNNCLGPPGSVADTANRPAPGQPSMSTKTAPCGGSPRVSAGQLLSFPGVDPTSVDLFDNRWESPANISVGVARGALNVILRGNNDSAETASARARRILEAGFHSASSFGSSTAIVVGLDSKNSTLGIANIGDSSCLALRRDSHHGNFVPFRRTREQQHFFNCPYQLSRIPKLTDLPYLASKGMHNLVRLLSSISLGGIESGDTPDMADLYDVRVKEGDLIIVATDGVFDNLFDQEIASLLSLSLSPREAAELESSHLWTRPPVAAAQSRRSLPFSLPHPLLSVPPIVDPKFGLATPPQLIAQALAEAAFYRSLHPRAPTPFARQARKAGGLFLGGKMDDITVVASWVTRKTTSRAEY